MGLASRTGLLASVKKPIQRINPKKLIEFPNVAQPAPYVLRPFAGVYNPFPYGCSILCNHPADYEAKDVVKRAKDTWATEGKSLLLPEELAAIRASLLRNAISYEDGEDMVPEELFRRYTDTDSRPMTPAPTLASAGTRGSGRRCVTPDATLNPARERTLLVLDLRRSHSQDTLSLHGLSLPASTILQSSIKTSSPTPDNLGFARKNKFVTKKGGTTPTPRPKSNIETSPERNVHIKENVLLKGKMKVTNMASTSLPELILPSDVGESGEEDNSMKRRGKKRKGRKSAGQDKEFHGLPDPGETQVSALGDELNGYHDSSVRPSPVSPLLGDESNPTPDMKPIHLTSDSNESSTNSKSFIDAAILKQLQRELDQEVIDGEFDPCRKVALEEALKSRPTGRRPLEGKELRLLKKQMQPPKSDNDGWLAMPRIFTRQSSRFELPLDSRTLNTMTPLQYVQGHVAVSSTRRLLYNLVFNRHREELDDEETDRRLKGQNVVLALGEVMGQSLTDTQAVYYQTLISWKDEDLLDFRTWCGVSALCERLLGPQLMSAPSRALDPCHEVEQADFETLPRKLYCLRPDPCLKEILFGIKEL